MWSRIKQWFRRRNRVLLVAFGVLLALLVLTQFLYPSDRLPLFASIDGIDVSGWEKKDAAWQLDQAMAAQPIAIKLGQGSKTYDTTKPADIGITITNTARVNSRDYPWYLQLVPTSLLWYGLIQPDGMPAYKTSKDAAKHYLDSKLGKSCNIPAKNASLTYEDKTLKVVSAVSGGMCNEEKALAVLTSARPQLEKKDSITISVQMIKPKVSDDQAGALKQQLLDKSEGGVTLTVAGKNQEITQPTVLSWLVFTTKKDKLNYTLDQGKANSYMKKSVTPLVAKKAGQTTISTRDFAVISKKVGATGQTLALAATLEDIKKVLEGEVSSAKAITTAVAPKTVYQRSYTHTSLGISALMTHYAEDYAGTFGVAFQELGGQGRVAQYNGDRIFVTASTYKLFVAYGTLKRVDAGKWKWSDKDIHGGRNLATCFDDMIVKSNNECAKALLLKIGVSTLTNEIHALGLTSSSFLHANIESTPSDLRSYLAMLQGGTLPISSTSRARLLDAMKRQIYRQGVPAGASGPVADKVGFLWTLLHDAAIVYSPKGTYVLVVMTDGSSWANIADLTRKIESLR